MTTIYCRSPFLVPIDEASQVSGKLELFIWKKGETEPVTPTITLTKNIASPTQKELYWDISPYIQDKIEYNLNVIDGDYAFETTKNWCYVRVKKYYNTTVGGAYILLTNTLYNSVYGYTDPLQGPNATPGGNSTYNIVNPGGTDIIKVLYNTSVTQTIGSDIINYAFGQISFLIEYTSGEDYYIRYRTSAGILYDYQLTNPVGPISTTASNTYYICVPLPYTADAGTIYDIQLVKDTSVYAGIGKYQLLESCKYSDSAINYINRYGGLETIPFFAKKTDTLDIKKTSYNLMNKINVISSSSITYDTRIGQSRDFNVNGSKNIKLNTGWVNENISIKMQDLMFSETALFTNGIAAYQQNVPVKIKTSSLKYQTHLNDKTINYEIDIELSSDVINNIS